MRRYSIPYAITSGSLAKILITTCLAGFVASIFTTVIGWKTANFYICTPFILISCIPLGVINVISNAMMVKAAFLEIPVKVDATCCAGVTPQSHDNALNAMEMCQIEVTGR